MSTKAERTISEIKDRLAGSKLAATMRRDFCDATLLEAHAPLLGRSMRVEFDLQTSGGIFLSVWLDEVAIVVDRHTAQKDRAAWLDELARIAGPAE